MTTSNVLIIFCVSIVASALAAEMIISQTEIVRNGATEISEEVIINFFNMTDETMKTIPEMEEIYSTDKD